jgi:hypothetical protein
VAVTQLRVTRDGQVLVFFALVLPIVLLPVAAYAIDASVYAAAVARLQGATALAAEEAAQQVDGARLRTGGGVGLNVLAAGAAARNAMAAADPAARVAAFNVAGINVSVSATEDVDLPLVFLGPSPVTVRATATARLTTGYASPSSRLPLPTSTF